MVVNTKKMNSKALKHFERASRQLKKIVGLERNAPQSLDFGAGRGWEDAACKKQAQR